LKNYSLWSVVLHYGSDNWLEDCFVRNIVNAIAKGEVHSVVLSLTDTNITQFACTREVFTILVERDGHDSVSGVESFLDTIAMMNVNVNVENTGLEAEEFDYAEYDIL
jgi:hypothetical protein